MRLDLFLKVSRLCPRRAVAQELCDVGAVLVNKTPAKSARIVNAGDEISLRRRNRLLNVRVLAVPTTRQTSRSEASSLYEILSEETIGDES